MIALTNTIAQTLTPGQAITFDEVILHSGCGECHRANSNNVKLRATGVYEVSFSGNIGATAAATPATLAFQLSGQTLPESTMISTTTTVGDLNNVAKTIPVKNCCGDYDRISVVNIGTADITIGANPILYIRRVS